MRAVVPTLLAHHAPLALFVCWDVHHRLGMAVVHPVATQHSVLEPRLPVCRVLQDHFVWLAANALRVMVYVPRAVFQPLEVESPRHAALAQLELSTQSMLRSHHRRVSPALEERIVSLVARKPMAMEFVLPAVFPHQAAAKRRCATLARPGATVCKDAPRMREVDFVQMEHSLRPAQESITAARRAPQIPTLILVVLPDVCRVTPRMGGTHSRNLQVARSYLSIHATGLFALLLLLSMEHCLIRNSAGTDIQFGCIRFKAQHARNRHLSAHLLRHLNLTHFMFSTRSHLPAAAINGLRSFKF